MPSRPTPVRRPALALTAAASALAACGGGGTTAPADPGHGGPLVTIARLRADRTPLTLNSGLRTAQRLVIRDDAAWQGAWTNIWASLSPTPDRPAVDFTREMVVVAALGEHGTGGYTILVDSAAAEGDGLVVWVHGTSPGRDCLTTQSLTQPVDAARVPRVAGGVEFRESAEVEDCR